MILEPATFEQTFSVLLVMLQLFIGEEEFLGVVVPTEKSDELKSVSVQPPEPRVSQVIFEGVGAAAKPSKQFALPKPTKSTIEPPVGQDPLNAVVELTKAIFPAVALIAIDPIKSGMGKAMPFDPPAICTKK